MSSVIDLVCSSWGIITNPGHRGVTPTLRFAGCSLAAAANSEEIWARVRR
jgi:hypothetical protein